MKRFTLKQFREAYTKLKTQGVSMRRRFSLFLIAMIAAVLAVLVLLLSFFGVLNPADSSVDRVLTQQLDHTVEDLEKSAHDLAAHSVEFSKQITSLVQKLERNGHSFDSLKNNKEVLAGLQADAYHIIYNNLQLADCSGAFYFLNTTVNDGLDNDYYNGIYLKYTNLNAETTIRNDICMFRGNAEIAKDNDINLHSAWEFEMESQVLPQIESLLNAENADPSKAWLLTTVYKVPQTYEYARYLCTTITDGNGNIIGVCGFEISDLYFRLSNQASSNEQEYLLLVCLTDDGDSYAGQIAGNRSGYIPFVHGQFSVKESGKFSKLSAEGMTFIGKTEDVTIGTSTHTVAVMLNSEYYDAYISSSQMKLFVLLAFVAALAVAVSIWMSHYYVKPIIQAMEKIKAKETTARTRIPEINDLLDFLEAQDREHEAEVQRLHGEKTAVESQYEQVQTYVTHLADERMPEVNEDDFEMFLKHLSTLTPKEREIFDYYLAGKKAKEIMELAAINQNTLKYHNKNIYSKLGVTSRKQLLEYAALMKYRREG